MTHPADSPTALIVTTVLVALATYRLTRLITADTITAPFRSWLTRHFYGKLVNLFTCPWCLSMYLAAGVTLGAVYAWSWWRWVCVTLTASAATGWLAEHE